MLKAKFSLNVFWAVILMSALLSWSACSQTPVVPAGTSGGVENAATQTGAVEKSSSLLGSITYEEPAQSVMINYDNDPKLVVPANMMLVLVKDGTSEADVESMVKDLDGKVVGKFDYVGFYQVQTKSTNQAELDGLVKKASGYKFVEKAGPMMPVVDKDVEGKPCRILDDVYSDPKAAAAHEMIGLEQAWDLIRASGVKLNNVTVGVVDSGLNESSSDGKKGTKIQALDKTDATNAPTKFNSHGTLVSNMIGASWENGGMRGVAGGLGDKLTVNVASLRKAAQEYAPIGTQDTQNIAQIDYSGQAYLVNTFEQIKRQVDAGAQIINYSQGSVRPGTQNAVENAIYKKFLERMQKDYPKVLFVAAAGNEGDELQTDPVTGVKRVIPLDGSNYDMGGTKADNLITVGSLNSDGTNSSFTNTATGDGEVTLAAQGTAVALGENADGTIHYANGTSFSTPQVAGAAAILKSINPDLTAKEIKDILVKTADTKLTNSKLLPKGVKEQAIDSGVGGRVLRLDKAVLDQLKVKLGDKFDEKKLENIAKLSAKAVLDKSDPLHFTITATIPEVRDEGTDVNVKFTGEGSFGGLSNQHLGSAGSLSWDWRFLSEKNSAMVTVTRTDSGACSRLSLKPSTIAGTYKGTMDFAFPEYAAYLSKSSFNIPSTLVIDAEGKAEMTFADSGSINSGGNGVFITTSYTGSGKMNGTATEDLKLNLSGGYTSTYNTKVPGNVMAAMPAAQRAMLSGTGSGSCAASATISDKTVSGSVTFANAQGGGTSKGTFKLEKVEE